MYKGLRLTSLKILPMYIPIIPNTIRIIPVENKILAIKLAHPVTKYFFAIAFSTIIRNSKNEVVEKKAPKSIEIFSGLFENDIIISTASDNLFEIEYPGFPLNL